MKPRTSPSRCHLPTVDRAAVAIVASAAAVVAIALHSFGADWPRIIGGAVLVVSVCMVSILARPFYLAFVISAEVRRQGRDIDRRLDDLEREIVRRPR